MAPTTMRHAIVPILLTAGLTSASPLPANSGQNVDSEHFTSELACTSIAKALPLVSHQNADNIYNAVCTFAPFDTIDDLAIGETEGTLLTALVPNVIGALQATGPALNAAIEAKCSDEITTLCTGNTAATYDTTNLASFASCADDFVRNFFNEPVEGYSSYCAKVLSEVDVGDGSKAKRHHLIPLATLHSNGLEHELEFDSGNAEKRELLNAVVDLKDSLVKIVSDGSIEKRELLNAVVDLKDNLVKVVGEGHVKKRELLSAVVDLNNGLVKAVTSAGQKRDLLNAVVDLDTNIVKTAKESDISKRELLSAVVGLKDNLVRLTAAAGEKREIGIHPKILGPALAKLLHIAPNKADKRQDFNALEDELAYPVFVAVGEGVQLAGPLVKPAADTTHDTIDKATSPIVDETDPSISDLEGEVASIPSELSKSLHTREILSPTCKEIWTNITPVLASEDALTTLLCAANPVSDSEEDFLLTALLGNTADAAHSAQNDKQPIAISNALGQIQQICRTKATGMCQNNGVKDASNCAEQVLAFIVNECESNFDEPSADPKLAHEAPGSGALHARGLRDESFGAHEVEALRKAWTAHNKEKPGVVPRQVEGLPLVAAANIAVSTVDKAAEAVHADDVLANLPRGEVLDEASAGTIKLIQDTESNVRYTANLVTDSTLAPAAQSVQDLYQEGIAVRARDLNGELAHSVADVNAIVAGTTAGLDVAGSDSDFHLTHEFIDPITGTVSGATNDLRNSLSGRAYTDLEPISGSVAGTASDISADTSDALEHLSTETSKTLNSASKDTFSALGDKGLVGDIASGADVAHQFEARYYTDLPGVTVNVLDVAGDVSADTSDTVSKVSSDAADSVSRIADGAANEVADPVADMLVAPAAKGLSGQINAGTV